MSKIIRKLTSGDFVGDYKPLFAITNQILSCVSLISENKYSI